MTGARRPRREDARLVRGAGTFVADLREPGCAEAVFVRSDVAHGDLHDVDLTAARTMPGVLAAWAQPDLPFLTDTPPMMEPGAARGRPWPPLATDRVRYFGQPLAIVVTADRYVAEDARDAARAEISPRPVL